MKQISMLCVLSVVLVAFSANAGDLPASLQKYLDSSEIHLNSSEVKAIVDGRPVGKVLKTATNDEMAIFGIIRINVPEQVFIDQFRNITELETGGGVKATGRFQSPAVPADAAALVMDIRELKKIADCVPGDCDLKLSQAAMKRLKDQIDFTKLDSSPGQAQSLFRKELADYVARYQKEGDQALAVYADSDRPTSVRDGLSQLLQHTGLPNADRNFATYINKYPTEKLPDTEDIFYWQKAQFGLKPVVRVSHLIIRRETDNSDVSYRIASKMLYANHYFRSALELKSIMPESSTPGGARSFYLVCLNRAYVDGLTGLKGMLIRGIVKGRTRDSLESYLAVLKKKTEYRYQQESVKKNQTTGDGR